MGENYDCYIVKENLKIFQKWNVRILSPGKLKEVQKNVNFRLKNERVDDDGDDIFRVK